MIFDKCFLPAEHGQSYDVIGGDHVVVKATAQDTAGAFTVLETTVPPNAGPPRHVHHRESETFYVLEGDFEFHIGEETITASPGAFLIAPAELPHHFRNISDRPGKLLIVCHPGGFEDFIREFAEIPSDVPPDFAKMAAVGSKYGIDFLPDA